MAGERPHDRSLVQWAHNKMIDHPNGVVELPQSSVRELATFMGCPHHKLATYLAQFIPEHPHDLDLDHQAAS